MQDQNIVTQARADDVNEAGQNEQEVVKTYTEDEVQELLQKEADRRVSSAMKKSEKDWQDIAIEEFCEKTEA